MSKELIDSTFTKREKSTPHKTVTSGTVDFPYADSIWYKSIFGLVLALTVFGFIYSIYLTNIALKRSGESLRDYKTNPDNYSTKSFKRVQNGRKIAWVTVFILLGEVLTFLIVF